jgi:hypothetical protein
MLGHLGRGSAMIAYRTGGEDGAHYAQGDIYPDRPLR